MYETRLERWLRKKFFVPFTGRIADEMAISNSRFRLGTVVNVLNELRCKPQLLLSSIKHHVNREVVRHLTDHIDAGHRWCSFAVNASGEPGEAQTLGEWR